MKHEIMRTCEQILQQYAFSYLDEGTFMRKQFKDAIVKNTS